MKFYIQAGKDSDMHEISEEIFTILSRNAMPDKAIDRDDTKSVIDVRREDVAFTNFAWDCIPAFSEIFEWLVGSDLEEDYCANLLREIPVDMHGHLLLQMLAPEGLDKHKWLAIAEILGPDFAQQLYRAAVFVTKVA